ncbi:hypothetical protein D3C81_11250 [compost metagenome]
MGIFNFLKRGKEKRFNEFMKDLSNQSDSYLCDAWVDLDMATLCGTADEYTTLKLSAVEKELDKRGYVDDLGHVILRSESN